MADSHDTKHSSQSTDNRSFNDDYEIYEHLGYGYNSDSGTVKALAVDGDGHLLTSMPAGEVSQATNYALYGSTSDATYDYVGKQSADGQWYILRIHKTTGVATYAVGASDMATAWAAVGTQTYGDWDTYNQATANVAQASNVTIENASLVVSPYFTTGTGTSQVPRLNPETHVLNTIDYAHHEIHRGSSYFYTDSVEIASGNSQDYMITTPNTTAWAHMTFLITGSAITQVRVYETSDRTGTTAQTILNHDRNSDNTSGIAIHKAASGGTTDGTLIWQRKSGSATAQARGAGEAEHGMEIILKQNTKYIFKVTSGTNANLTNVVFDWYEHTNRTA